MYKIEWDKDTGGVLLSSTITDETLSGSPRPVFYEELDLIGLNKAGWSYPHCKEPIMWAINKRYWYRGVFLFEISGANIYDAPTLAFASGIKPFKLTAVNVEAMLAKNYDPIFLIESEAIEFIRNLYADHADANRAYDAISANREVDYEALAEKSEKKSKSKLAIVKEDCDSFDIVPLETAKNAGKRVLLSTHIDRFVASFSGGKDSQVTLDLCTRAIPPTEFEVIYSDTGYELPSSLELYKKIEERYKRLYPALKFTTTRNHKSVMDYWDEIGTPSDTHRWCCSVMKTAPLYRSLKIDGNKQAKVLTFDGVRAEESAKRSIYDRVGKGKHIYVYNAHPILNWNTTEIFLYLFKHDLYINDAYRHGKARVGCIVCPFSTTWDDYVISNLYPKELRPFADKIKEFSKKNRIQDSQKFLSERKWKIKTLGNPQVIPRISYEETKEKLTIKIERPRQSIFAWLPALCNYTVRNDKDGSYSGELKFKDFVLTYELSEDPGLKNSIFTIDNAADDKIIFLIKRLALKTAHCINCEVCEVDCPTGALSIIPKITIDKSKCIHCHKCLNTHQRGCIVADCNRMAMNSDSETVSIYGYKKFGLREEWVNDYMTGPEDFWKSNNWGKPMYESFKRWGKDAELLDSKNEQTELGRLLQKIHEYNPRLVWEIFWINLSYNSFIANKFCTLIRNGRDFNANTLKEMVIETGTVNSITTLQNACTALIETLVKSPIGESLEQGIKNGKMLTRNQYADLSIDAIAYSVYKFAETRDAQTIRVSDIYSTEAQDGVNVQFCLPKAAFEKGLRTLSSQADRILIAELNMGLDHITINKEMSSIDILRKMAL